MTIQGDPRRKTAAAYRRRDKIILGRVDHTRDGIPFGPVDPVVLSSAAEDAALGRAVLVAISSSRLGVDPLGQADWDHGLRHLLRAAEVNSWRTFVRGTRSVDIWSTPGRVELDPLVNLGARSGFGGRAADSIEVGSDDADRVGKALRRALDLATE